MYGILLLSKITGRRIAKNLHNKKHAFVKNDDVGLGRKV